MVSFTMGDVRRMMNGNTLVTFSANGQIHEVSPDGAVIKEIAWQLGSIIGYSTWRYSLYYKNYF